MNECWMGIINVDEVGLLSFSLKGHCICCLWSCVLSSYFSAADKVLFHVQPLSSISNCAISFSFTGSAIVYKGEWCKCQCLRGEKSPREC
jgi:hypothetical protein